MHIVCYGLQDAQQNMMMYITRLQIPLDDLTLILCTPAACRLLQHSMWVLFALLVSCQLRFVSLAGTHWCMVHVSGRNVAPGWLLWPFSGLSWLAHCTGYMPCIVPGLCHHTLQCKLRLLLLLLLLLLRLLLLRLLLPFPCAAAVEARSAVHAYMHHIIHHAPCTCCSCSSCCFCCTCYSCC
jgi:hypothetical protein